MSDLDDMEVEEFSSSVDLAPPPAHRPRLMLKVHCRECGKRQKVVYEAGIYSMSEATRVATAMHGRMCSNCRKLGVYASAWPAPLNVFQRAWRWLWRR